MLTHTKYWLPVSFSLAFSAILCLTLNAYGPAWDEAYYGNAGRTYVSWLKHPFEYNSDSYWKTSHEHPPLAKLVGGISRYIFCDKLAMVDRYTAFRLENVLLCFILTFTIIVWASSIWDKWTAVLAAAFCFFLPRFYFEAHVGQLDYPISVMIAVTSMVFWKGLTSNRWLVFSSVLIGLSLLTKITAVFFWVLLAAWYLFRVRKELRSRVWPAASLFLIPPVIFIAGWPWFWHDTYHRVMNYFIWMSGHDTIPGYYLGQECTIAPWHYPFVMTIVTVPLILLVPAILAVSGLFKGAKAEGERYTATVFLALLALMPIGLIAFASPVRGGGGVRLFLPAFPFICILSAVGIRQAWRFFEKRGDGKYVLVLVSVLLLLSVSFAVRRCHRYQECYLNELVSSQSARQFETESTSCSLQEIIPWLNAHKDKVFWFPVAPRDMVAAYSAWIVKFDPGVRLAGEAHCDWVVLLSRQGMFEDRAWWYYRHEAPISSVSIGDFTVIRVYRRVL